MTRETQGKSEDEKIRTLTLVSEKDVILPGWDLGVKTRNPVVESG